MKKKTKKNEELILISEKKAYIISIIISFIFSIPISFFIKKNIYVHITLSIILPLVCTFLWLYTLMVTGFIITLSKTYKNK